MTSAQCTAGTCDPPRCAGGVNAGTACSVDAECPGSECGAGLFDFNSRLVDGIGPVLLRVGACIGGTNALVNCSDDSQCPGGQCGAFTSAALDPVPLDGLNQSAALDAFVMEEAIAEPPVDLNGDGDKTDPVIKLVDRSSGVMQPIGDGGSDARAITRVHESPFSFPAVALEGDVIGFLEPEPLQGAADINANGRIFDQILKVYRLSGGELSDSLQPLAADATPVIDHRSLVISNGLVFFRSNERVGALQETTRVNVDANGTQASGGTESISPSLSGDGRYVAFSSDATNLVPNDTNNQHDVFVHDRVSGATVRVSVSSTGAEGSGFSSFSPFISANGRHVVFASISDNLVPGDTVSCNGSPPGFCQDVFVHDRDADGDGIFDESNPGERRTVMVSVSSTGTPGDDKSLGDRMAITPDGRFVVYASLATNLDGVDANGVMDVFVHDRDADTDGMFDETGVGERSTVRISSDVNALAAAGVSGDPSISDDGRFVVFRSSACNLIAGDCVTAGDTNNATDIFLHDRDTDADGVFDEPARPQRRGSASIRSGTRAMATATTRRYRAMVASSCSRALPTTSSPAIPTTSVMCSYTTG